MLIMILSLISNRQQLINDDCLEDNRENYPDYQNCSALYCIPQLICISHASTVLIDDWRFSFRLAVCFCCFNFNRFVCVRVSHVLFSVIVIVNTGALNCPGRLFSEMTIPYRWEDALSHDLLLRSYLYHCVWSVITAHNLTPEKRGCP